MKFKKFLIILILVCSIISIILTLYFPGLEDSESRYFINNNEEYFHWYNFSNLFIDKQKSATFYMQSASFLVKILLPTRKLNQLINQTKIVEVSIIDKETGNNVFRKRFFSQHESIIMSNHFYTFSLVREKIKEIVKVLNHFPKSVIQYQLEFINIKSEVLTARIVFHKANSNIKVARLTKCLYTSNFTNKLDLRKFKIHLISILRLNAKLNFKVSYICNFNDKTIRKILGKFKNVQEIVLKKVPNFLVTETVGDGFIHQFHEISNYENNSTLGADEIFDPVSEFIYNLIYPDLVDHYSHVFIGDVDQLILPEYEKDISKHITGIYKKNKLISKFTSLYFEQQYWYLQNNYTRYIIYKIKHSLNRLDSDFTYPILIEIDPFFGFKFDLAITNEEELNYAHKLIKKNKKNPGRYEEMCRLMYVKFYQPSIYGQTVHATHSSEVVKLCTPYDKLHMGGRTFRVSNEFSVSHFRFKFDISRIWDEKSQLRVIQLDFDDNLNKYCYYKNDFVFNSVYI
jgi:hypothetical protein